MTESKIVERTHEYMLENDAFDLAIDATCGNGYDTLFLAKYYKKVISLDIQAIAIKRTKEKTAHLPNVELHLDDFNHLNEYPKANLIIFNLGFLPGSNRVIKTQDYSSNEAILKAYEIVDGSLLIACYVQHEGGMEEYKKIISTLNEKHIPYLLEDSFEAKEKLIIIKKKMA